MVYGLFGYNSTKNLLIFLNNIILNFLKIIFLLENLPRPEFWLKVDLLKVICFWVLKIFLKKIIFYFLFYFKLIFLLVFSDDFDIVILKIKFIILIYLWIKNIFTPKISKYVNELPHESCLQGPNWLYVLIWWLTWWLPRKENPLAMPLALYYQKPPWLPHREYAKHPLTSTRHHHKTLGISLEAQSVGKIRDHPRSLLLHHRPENPNPTTKSSCLSKNRIFFNLQDSIFSYCICGDSTL
jgi:hypothetical protein